jgi:hypothetical protein
MDGIKIDVKAICLFTCTEDELKKAENHDFFGILLNQLPIITKAMIFSST